VVASSDAVRVEGLKELRRALGRIDKSLQKSLRGRLKNVGDKVAALARSKMPSRSGKARSSVKAGVSGNNAYVQGGRKSVPYVPWLDYGGTLRPTGRRRGTQHRLVVRKGRYLYPAIDEMRPDIEDGAVKAFEETKRELGLR
jgi:hypothetical protein